jgi:hypothetical protein
MDCLCGREFIEKIQRAHVGPSRKKKEREENQDPRKLAVISESNEQQRSAPRRTWEKKPKEQQMAR